MKKVFDPGELELADPSGDPNRVIAIQSKVKELIEANQQRKTGIFSELIDEGAWALPGLLNSTYVWMNRLEENKDAQDVLANIMAEMARDNESAVVLLFDSGILENPFKTSREIVLKALNALNWKPSSDQIAKIKSKISSQKNADDIEGLMLSFKLLVLSNDKVSFNMMLKQCEAWVEQNMDSGAHVFGLLVKHYPESTVKILTDVIMASRTLFNQRELAEVLINAIRPIPHEWWLDSSILKVSIDVLDKSDPPRNTVIEYLWKFAAQDAKQQNPQFWILNCKKINKLVFETVKPLDEKLFDIISRYWFEALGEAADKPDILKFIIDSAFSDPEIWAVNAAFELFFLRRNNNLVENALSKLSEENFYRYQRAETKYNHISPKNKAKTKVRTPEKAAGLKSK